MTNVQIVEFENGVEQRRDVWGGKTKKIFDIQFNVNSKAEIVAVHDYFVNQLGPATSFSFTCPIDGNTYTVRFVEDSFDIERRFFGTYFGRCRLVEVF